MEINFLKSSILSQVWGAHDFNPSTQRQRQVDVCQFKANLLYKSSFRTTRAVTQQNFHFTPSQMKSPL